MNMKKVIPVLIFLLIGIGIPYLIQFKCGFFGATMVTFRDVIGLWFICLMIGLAIGCLYYVNSKR